MDLVIDERGYVLQTVDSLEEHDESSASHLELQTSRFSDCDLARRCIPASLQVYSTDHGS